MSGSIKKYLGALQKRQIRRGWAGVRKQKSTFSSTKRILAQDEIIL